jgi:hypothetical protein
MGENRVYDTINESSRNNPITTINAATEASIAPQTIPNVFRQAPKFHHPLSIDFLPTYSHPKRKAKPT